MEKPFRSMVTLSAVTMIALVFTSGTGRFPEQTVAAGDRNGHRKAGGVSRCYAARQGNALVDEHHAVHCVNRTGERDEQREESFHGVLFSRIVHYNCCYFGKRSGLRR